VDHTDLDVFLDFIVSLHEEARSLGKRKVQLRLTPEANLWGVGSSAKRMKPRASKLQVLSTTMHRNSTRFKHFELLLGRYSVLWQVIAGIFKSSPENFIVDQLAAPRLRI
jgi:hypothetical protein